MLTSTLTDESAAAEASESDPKSAPTAAPPGRVSPQAVATVASADELLAHAAEAGGAHEAQLVALLSKLPSKQRTELVEHLGSVVDQLLRLRENEAEARAAGNRAEAARSFWETHRRAAFSLIALAATALIGDLGAFAYLSGLDTPPYWATPLLGSLMGFAGFCAALGSRVVRERSITGVPVPRVAAKAGPHTHERTR